MRVSVATCMVALALVGLSASPAAAEIVTFKRSAGWEAFGGRSTDNRKLCGISASGGGRWFGVKYFEGDDNLTIQLSKNTWTVKNGAQIDIAMQVDREGPWTASATAFHMDGGDGAIEFTIGRKQINEWFNELRYGNTLYVRFPRSDVEDWQADLSGTQEIVDAMGECLQAMMNSQ
jgi:hypothetical protein